MLSNWSFVGWKSHFVMLFLGLVFFMPNAVGRHRASQTSSRPEQTPARFIPAIKDGRFVSTHLQIEYTFNLY